MQACPELSETEVLGLLTGVGGVGSGGGGGDIFLLNLKSQTWSAHRQLLLQKVTPNLLGEF